MQTETMGASQSQKQTYTVAEIATILGISKRGAYNYCNRTKDFRVMRLGSLIRIHQESFDKWFYQS